MLRSTGTRIRGLAVGMALAGILCIATGPARGQSIGVFFDPNGTTCSTTIPAFSPATIYMLAILGGAASGGISGVEFRVEGMPAGWFLSFFPGGPGIPEIPPNPFGPGANIAFFSCQSGTGGVVGLVTVQVFATTPVSNLYLTVQRHPTPSNPQYQCPVMLLCDPPNYTAICAAGGQGIINGPPCTVAVQPETWSRVREMYR